MAIYIRKQNGDRYEETKWRHILGNKMAIYIRKQNEEIINKIIQSILYKLELLVSIYNQYGVRRSILQS